MDSRIQDLYNDFHKAFNLEPSKFDLNQLWALTKFAKHVRLRCRNNSAFNNFMNSLFSPARFAQVAKESFCRCTNYGKEPANKYCDKCHGTGKYSYEGLKIVKNNETKDDNDGE